MKPFFYVYRVDHRMPKIKHFSLESAVKEAERLSVQHPGETFEILQCLGVTRTVTPQTFWMDGVVPPKPVVLPEPKVQTAHNVWGQTVVGSPSLSHF